SRSWPRRRRCARCSSRSVRRSASSVAVSPERPVRFGELAAAVVLAIGLSQAAAGPDPKRTAEQLAEQRAAELRALDTASTTVGDKLDAVEALRVRRVRAAYRILRGSLSSDASPSDRMAWARRRAAARLLLERDRYERTLLADEATHL